MARAATGWFVLLVLAGAVPLQAQKTDVVTLENGDEITGEIKQLDRGKLEYGTDDMGTVEIEWNKVEKIASIWFFEVELRSGLRYFGTFLDGAEPGTLIVALPPDRDTLSLASIIRIQPIQVSFWQQLDGFVDVGFNYAQANRNTQLTASARASYRGRRWGSTTQGETYFQTQTDAGGTGQATSRNSAQFSLERFFDQSLWSAVVFTSVEQNAELNLAIRGRLGGGVRRTMQQSNSSIVRMAGGVSLSAERFTSDTAAAGTESTNALNLEGLIQFEWAVFRFDAPELDLLTTVQVLPSITDLGRVRSDIDIRVSYELVKDFFLALTGNTRLDSRPPSADATKVDFGTKFTIGWSF
ncbi:MAG: DUF481 domain-containing protein [Gemmatimonadetes bacterium]|nr:DUF481 domain-containing protein [Gemmatimonadota bacterium]